MNCSKCNKEMKKGMLDRSRWISGEPPLGKGFLSGVTKTGMWPIKRKVDFVSAYKCPSCGKIELYAEK